MAMYLGMYLMADRMVILGGGIEDGCAAVMDY